MGDEKYIDTLNIQFDAESNLYKCKLCGKGFEKLDSCKMHMIHHAKELNELYGKKLKFQVKCDICKKDIERTEREKLFDSERKYYCCASCRQKGLIVINGIGNFTMKGRKQTEERNKRAGDSIREVWNRPGYRDNMKEVITGVQARPEVKTKKGESLKRAYKENPELGKNLSAKQLKRYEDPAQHERQSKNNKEIWARPGYKEKMRVIISISQNKPETLALHRANGIRNSANRTIKTYCSKGELEVVTFFKETFPEDKWTRGGGFSIGKYEDGLNVHKQIDCYSKKLKVMIEYDGPLHFIDNWRNKTKLIEPGFKDKMLNEWGPQNGWKIIRISDPFYLENREEAKKLLVDFVYHSEEKIHFFGEEYKQFETEKHNG